MLDLTTVDLDEIAMALQDQTTYEYRWLIDPKPGRIVVWTEDGGIHGRTPVPRLVPCQRGTAPAR